MKNLVTSFLFVVAVASVFLGCAGKATDPEVEQMCRHLTELRSKGNATEANTAEELQKCKADKMVTDVSSETAACRIAAKDVDTFWNKCR